MSIDWCDPCSCLQNYVGSDMKTYGLLKILCNQQASSGPVPSQAYDAITMTEPSPEVEVYAYRTGGDSGTIVMTVTVTYTDASKETLVSVVWS